MLADPTRIRLLWTLVDGKLSVNECPSVQVVAQHLRTAGVAQL